MISIVIYSYTLSTRRQLRENVIIITTYLYRDMIVSNCKTKEMNYHDNSI